jgi:hypothetical protein
MGLARPADALDAGFFFAGAALRAFAGREGRRLADEGRFLAPPRADAVGLDFRAGLRVDEVRAFAARRNFAMPGG